MSRDEAIVTPEGWLSRGQAFVRGHGAELAVFGGIPGEKVRVVVEHRGGHLDQARVVGPVGRPDRDRVTPPCERWSACGRCPLMHLTPEGQASAQQALVRAALPMATPVVRAPAAQAFSHTLQLVAGYSDERHPRIGVPGRDPRRLIAIPGCPVTTATLREVMKVAAHHMIAMDVQPWDGRRGSLRAVLAHQSASSGEVLLTLVYARPTPFAALFAEAIGGAVQEVAGICAHWNDDLESILDRDEPATSVIYGRPTIEENVDGLRIRLSALDPWPAMPITAGWLEMVDALDPADGDAVLELGAGVGARTLLLARRGGWAMGVEAEDLVMRHARENAALNGIAAEFAPSLEACSPRLAGRRPHVLADTGRAGLSEPDAAGILALSPRRVALTSINPKALARDIARFTAQGWTLRSVVPRDVSPYTTFVETTALLDPADTAAPTIRAPRRRRV